jgi:hypothetical protein
VSSSKKPPKKPSKKPSRARTQATRAKKSVETTASKPKRPAVVSSRAATPTARRSPAKAPRATRTVAQKPVAAPPAPPPQPAPAQRTGIRLAGSASSRLTIKPGPPQGSRLALVPSTKPRPGGIRPLSEVELDEEEVLIDGFDALLEGQKVRITAVLERTCVYVDRGGDRKLARKEDLLIEADKLPIRRRGIG